MSGISENNKRIATNTISLYTRNLLTLFIGLFTVRIVLKTLGEEDYGIYTVVAGSLAFLTFISGALSVGSQRFFSYALGKNDQNDLSKIFSVTFTIYFILILLILIISESIGVWFINTQLKINESRIIAANIVFQLVIISTAISLLSSPFMMAIMAHEDMGIFGKMAVLDSIIKIVICILLVISPFDKLITYVAMLLACSFIVQMIYVIFAWRRYEECRFKLVWDNDKTKIITSFSGWNLFGNLAWVGKNQGVSILLNVFFGPIVNAAQGVAMTIRNVTATFSTNFSSAISPQIVKKYANHDIYGMSTLVHRGSKMTYFLMLIVVVPIILSIDFVLQLWIGDHSKYMMTFCQIMLIESLIDSISSPMASANQATGKIALYQGLIGMFGIMTLPVAYILLKLGFEAEWVFITSLFFQLFVVGVRVIFLKRIYPNAIKEALKKVIFPCLLVTFVSIAICLLIHIDINNIITCLWALCLYILICCVCIWLIGFTRNERSHISSLVLSKLKIHK